MEGGPEVIDGPRGDGWLAWDPGRQSMGYETSKLDVNRASGSSVSHLVELGLGTHQFLGQKRLHPAPLLRYSGPSPSSLFESPEPGKVATCPTCATSRSVPTLYYYSG